MQTAIRAFPERDGVVRFEFNKHKRVSDVKMLKAPCRQSELHGKNLLLPNKNRDMYSCPSAVAAWLRSVLRRTMVQGNAFPPARMGQVRIGLTARIRSMIANKTFQKENARIRSRKLILELQRGIDSQSSD